MVRRPLGDLYREPMQFEAGEVPADFLARLAESPTKVAAESHHRVTTSDLGEPRLSSKSAELLGISRAGNGARTRDPQLGNQTPDRELWRFLGYFDEPGYGALSRRTLLLTVRVPRAVVPPGNCPRLDQMGFVDAFTLAQLRQFRANFG